jgi:hypothetical protein
MGINSADMRLGSKRESDAECDRRSAAFSAVDHETAVAVLEADPEKKGREGILPTLMFAQPGAQALGVQLDIGGKNVT